MIGRHNSYVVKNSLSLGCKVEVDKKFLKCNFITFKELGAFSPLIGNYDALVWKLRANSPCKGNSECKMNKDFEVEI